VPVEDGALVGVPSVSLAADAGASPAVAAALLRRGAEEELAVAVQARASVVASLSASVADAATLANWKLAESASVVAAAAAAPSASLPGLFALPTPRWDARLTAPAADTPAPAFDALPPHLARRDRYVAMTAAEVAAERGRLALAELFATAPPADGAEAAPAFVARVLAAAARSCRADVVQWAARFAAGAAPDALAAAAPDVLRSVVAANDAALVAAVLAALPAAVARAAVGAGAAGASPLETAEALNVFLAQRVPGATGASAHGGDGDADAFGGIGSRLPGAVAPSAGAGAPDAGPWPAQPALGVWAQRASAQPTPAALAESNAVVAALVSLAAGQPGVRHVHPCFARGRVYAERNRPAVEARK
jgi:hypothetical protein